MMMMGVVQTTNGNRTRRGATRFCTLRWGVGVGREEDVKRAPELVSGQLRKWADLLVIAPISANTLSKIANGMADNLLVTQALSCIQRRCLTCPAGRHVSPEPGR